jgi:hypothetical protein
MIKDSLANDFIKPESDASARAGFFPRWLKSEKAVLIAIVGSHAFDLGAALKGSARFALGTAAFIISWERRWLRAEATNY